MCCHDCNCNRRDFVQGAAVAAAATAAAAAGAFAAVSAAASVSASPAWGETLWDPARPFAIASKPLRVLPILTYRIAERREATSWKSWGGVQSHDTAAEEAGRIEKQLGQLRAEAAKAGVALEFLPVARVTTPQEAQNARTKPHDAVVVFPATGGGDVLRACFDPGNRTLIFVRHRSGSVYYWYEALSVKYLRTPKSAGQDKKVTVDGVSVPDGPSIDDVVVDDPRELAWRLRSLWAAKNFLGARILTLGGAGGKYDSAAPQVARERYKFDIVDLTYDDLGKRMRSALADPATMGLAERWTNKYLALPGTKLETERKFVVNSFALYGVLKGLLREANTSLFTINMCMGTIMPMAETTACLTLSLLNDEGVLALCESDYVIIPACVLMYYVSGKPVFLHNSTFPHDAVVTCAHCTAPRRMNGARYEPARILTHYESEYGAAPKIDMPLGQTLSCIDPEYATGRWIGIKGTVQGNPFYDICRSQQEVRIQGDWRRLLCEVRDSHWVAAYGDHLRELAYAASRIGVNWEAIS